MAVRCADCPRRWHRNREASETRFAQTADASLSDFGTSDVAPSTGIHCNGNGHFTSNGNGTRRPGLPFDTVASHPTQGERMEKVDRSYGNGKSNRTSRCAELKATATVAARS